MKKRKFGKIAICAAMIMSMSLAGCQGSSSAAQTRTETASAENTAESDAGADETGQTQQGSSKAQGNGENVLTSEDEDLSLTGTTIRGMVSAVEDNTITMQVFAGGGPGGRPDGDSSNSQQPPEMPQGESRDGQSSDGQEASQDTRSGSEEEKNSDSSNSNRPQRPDGQSRPDGFPGGSGSTVTLVLDDASVLKNSDGESAVLSDIEQGKMLEIETDDAGGVKTVTIRSGFGGRPGGPGSSDESNEQGSPDSSDASGSQDSQNSQDGGPGGMPGAGQSSGVDSYNAVADITQDTESEGETYTSSGADENAILVEGGATAKITDAAITRDSADGKSSGGDNASFYGVGAAVLAADGTAYINGGTITTDADGGAGAFAYGDGTVYIKDTKISTSQGASGGIHAAGGGKLYAWNVTAETDGQSSAAIRSDRGGGTMIIDGGSYTSNGTGSPAIYSTADIVVNGAQLTAAGSEAVCIEGLNSVRLYDCDLSGNMGDDSGQNDCTWNVIVYQSMSGDAAEGNGTFSMIGGTLKAENGGMFYTTNTESTFYLSGVDITYADENDFFLKCTGNSNARGWGSSGANGADCSFTADAQAMEGNVLYDSISQLDFYMVNGSILTGAFLDDESNAGEGGSGYCNLTLDELSVWTVTQDSAVSALYNEGTIEDKDGNTVSIIGTDGTVYVEGESDLTVTVGSYSDKADLSGAAASSSFDDAAVANPF